MRDGDPGARCHRSGPDYQKRGRLDDGLPFCFSTIGHGARIDIRGIGQLSHVHNGVTILDGRPASGLEPNRQSAHRYAPLPEQGAQCGVLPNITVKKDVGQC